MAGDDARAKAAASAQANVIAVLTGVLMMHAFDGMDQITRTPEMDREGEGPMFGVPLDPRAMASDLASALVTVQKAFGLRADKVLDMVRRAMFLLEPDGCESAVAVALDAARGEIVKRAKPVLDAHAKGVS